MRKRIQFIPFEIKAFLADTDYQFMNAQQRGVYLSLIIYMYANDGKCPLDMRNLRKLTGCKNISKVWHKIKKKFQIKEGVITHKRVTRELRSAKRLMQAKKKAGLKGAKGRWHSHSRPNGTPNGKAMANENVNNNKNVNENTNEKRNEIEEEENNISNSNTKLRASDSPISFRPRPPRAGRFAGDAIRLDKCYQIGNIEKKLSGKSNL